MFRRRRRAEDAPSSDSDQTEATVDELDDVVTTVNDGDDLADSPKTPRPDGPYDASEVDLDEARATRIDLGGLLVQGVPGMQLQLQVDQRTRNGTSALLGLGDAGIQLVAVAAPRSSGLWGQTMLQIEADARRRGGTAEEAHGPFGTEVRVVVPVNAPDGKRAMQPSRVSGIDGPRWLLRATFLGKATTDVETFQRLVGIVKQVVVVRGDAPMAPGDVITLRAPTNDDLQGENPPPTPPGTQA